MNLVGNNLLHLNTPKATNRVQEKVKCPRKKATAV